MSSRRWWLVSAVTVLACALSAGCTPDPDPGPTPSSSPTAVSPSPSSTPTRTPPETDIERQMRLDYEAAEKVYRRFRVEYRRVLRAGGAKQATKVMKETAGNGYLSALEEVVQGYKSRGGRQEGQEKIGYVRGVGYTSTRLSLEVCEDDRPVKALDRDGKSIGPGEVRALKLEMRKARGAWKVWSGDGKVVDGCS